MSGKIRLLVYSPEYSGLAGQPGSQFEIVCRSVLPPEAALRHHVFTRFARCMNVLLQLERQRNRGGGRTNFDVTLPGNSSVWPTCRDMVYDPNPGDAKPWCCGKFNQFVSTGLLGLAGCLPLLESSKGCLVGVPSAGGLTGNRVRWPRESQFIFLLDSIRRQNYWAQLKTT